MPVLGLIVNPIAGMGGAVGLKGTDGPGILAQAKEKGAKPVSPFRAVLFLNHLKKLATGFDLLVAPGPMGEDIASSVHLPYSTMGQVHGPTSAQDTINIASMMSQAKIGLIVFCGGDGTARDVLKAVSDSIPVLGIPSGVKVYSSVFAVNPLAAAETVAEYLGGKLSTRKGEVLDIDEEDYRANKLSVKLEGYLITPDSGSFIQSSKSPSPSDESLELEAIARYVKEEADPNIIYILGPGTTIARIAEEFGVKKTLLGVDVIKGDGSILGTDVSESELLQLIEGPSKIIISPIGGQGFLFGRGNQQISSKIIRKIGLDSVIVVATPRKIMSLHPRRLIVDTGDATLDEELRGYRRVLTSYREEVVVKVE